MNGKTISEQGGGTGIKMVVSKGGRSGAAGFSTLVASSLPVVIQSPKPMEDFAGKWISPGISELTGYSEKEFLSDPHFWAQNIHPEDAPGVLRGFCGLSRAGKLTTEYRWRCADGNYRWILNHAVLVRARDLGPPVVQSAWLDIDERKHNELSLRLGNQFLESLLGGKSGGMFILDQWGKYVYLCDAGRSMLRISRRDCVRGRARIIDGLGDPEAALSCFYRARSGAPSKGVFIVKGPRGSRKLAMSFSPFTWQHKPLVSGAILDVTDQKKEGRRLLLEARRGLCNLLRAALPGRDHERLLGAFRKKFDRIFENLSVSEDRH